MRHLICRALFTGFALTGFASVASAQAPQVDAKSVEGELSVRNCGYVIYGSQRQYVNDAAMDCIIENKMNRQTRFGEFRYRTYDRDGVKLDERPLERFEPKEPTKVRFSVNKATKVVIDRAPK